MYLKPGYFAEKGPHPADDIGQGYLTVTVAADTDQLPAESLEAARTDPDNLGQFEPDPDLIKAVALEADPEGFDLFRNDEIAFDGMSDCGYIGYGLDIAFNSKTGIALVAYRGPALPSLVRRYECSSADAAADLWVAEWAEPLVFAEDLSGDDTLTVH